MPGESAEPPLVKADFITSLVLVALGGAVVFESWRMPRLEERGVQIYSVPGIVPGLLGAIILLFGMILLVRSALAGGYRLGAEGGSGVVGWRNSGAGRLVLTLVITLSYAIGLVGQIPYWLATSLFVFVFIAVFEWGAGDARAARLRKLASALLQAILVAALVSFVFEKLFLVHLP